MTKAMRCDICGREGIDIHFNIFVSDEYEDLGQSRDICPECADLIESFIESIKEGTLAVGLIDYLVSVYGEDELIFILKQRGDKNGETKE